MGQRIAIVTDSTADFPAGVVTKLGIRLMPVHVAIDGVNHREGVTVSTRQLVGRMKHGARVSTRAPAPAEYADCFEALLGDYDRVLSFQVASTFSQCHASAENALALMAPRDAARVTVFDTKTLGVGQAIYTIMALRYLTRHGSIGGMKEALNASMEQSVSDLTVADLSWLRKSGALGVVPSMVGNWLDIKPILAISKGRLELTHRVRGMSRALDVMAAHAGEAKGRLEGAFEVWVAHCDAEESAFYLRNQLAEVLGKEPCAIRVVEAGASISVKVGPGSCSFILVPL